MSAKNEKAIVEIVIKGQQANATMKDMEKSVRALSAQMKNLPKDSQEFADKKAEFQKMSSSLKTVQNDVKGVGGVFQSISKEIKGFGILALGYLGFDWLKSSVSGIIKSNAELSDSLADIRKTTGMTEAEATKLNTAFSQINTRTATKELRNIAIVGGQLGIAKNDIFGFTVAVDKMNVALGDEFTGGAEEVTKAMGGLRNIFTDIKTTKVDDDLLHIGNAINELASSGAATGPVVSDFANRIGGVGITLGLTSGQVLGLSATLQELNVSTERGGTAVTKILQKMTTNTAEFAKVAGIPVKEFTTLVNKDLYGAFVKVVEGSKKSGDSATAFGKILNDLGVDGAGASEVFAKLGSNTQMLNEKVNLANTSLKQTDSIMAEFNTKNATLGAEMDRLSKSFATAFTNSTVSDGLKSMIGWMADLFDNTKKVSQGMDEERNTVNALVIEIKSSNTTNERRKEIYEELKAINPSIVEGIDKENISIQDLTRNVMEYNKQQINRIAIQKQQELIDEANQVAGEKAKEMASNQSKELEKLGKISQLNGTIGIKAKKILDDESLSIYEKTRALREMAQANLYVNMSKGRNPEAQKIIDLTGSTALLSSEKEYSKALEESNKLVEEKNSLMKILGIDSNNAKNEIDYTKLSIEQLNKYIKDSKESMGNYHRVEGAKSLEELKRRETTKKDTVLEIDQATKDKLIEARKKFLIDLEKLEEEYFNRKLSGPQKEEKAIFDKYDRILKQAKKGSSEYNKIIFLREQELEEFQKSQTEKYIKAKEDAQRKIDDATLPAHQKEINAVHEKYDELISVAQAYGISTEDIEFARRMALANLNDKFNQEELDKNDKKNKELLSQNAELNKKKEASVSDYYHSVSSALNDYNQYQKNMSEIVVSDMKKQNQSDLSATKRLLDAKIIGQGEYNRRTKKLEEQNRKEISAVKKKAAETDKKIAIFNALINGALTVSRAFKDYQYPASIAVAALAGISAFAQVSAISTQQVPEYAEGGLNRSTNPQGMVNSPTYFTNSSSGQDFIAGEKGAEWIAPNWMLQNPLTANTITMLEAVRQRGYVKGGLTSEVPSYTKSTSTSSNVTSTYTNSNELVSAINSLNSILSNGINAQLSYDQFTKDLKSIDSAKASSQIKN